MAEECLGLYTLVTVMLSDRLTMVMMMTMILIELNNFIKYFTVAAETVQQEHCNYTLFPWHQLYIHTYSTVVKTSYVCSLIFIQNYTVITLMHVARGLG